MIGMATFILILTLVAIIGGIKIILRKLGLIPPASFPPNFYELVQAKAMTTTDHSLVISFTELDGSPETIAALVAPYSWSLDKISQSSNGLTLIGHQTNYTAVFKKT